jgi:hypothetical protein
MVVVHRAGCKLRCRYMNLRFVPRANRVCLAVGYVSPRSDARYAIRRSSKVPPGDAGLPVCLDASIKIRLDILTIVDIVLRHSLYHSPTLPAPNGLSMRRPSTPCVLQSAESILPSLQASTWSIAYSRFNAYVMSKVGSSDAL